MKKLQFKKDDHDALFFKTLSRRVNDYFKKNDIAKTGNSSAHIKAGVLLFAYIIVFLSIFISNSYGQLLFAYGLLGTLTIFVALNIAHDAAHSTFSKNKKVNNLFLYTFDFLGASGYMWKLKHVHSHHPHVNIPNMDGDIKQSNLVRIFPNSKFLSFHKFQYLYMPVLYGLYTFVWLVFRDFKDFLQTDISGKPGLKHPIIEYVRLLLGKTFFFGRMLILPWLFLPFSFGQIFLAFFIFHLCASYTVALALISAHVGEHSVYPEPDEDGNMNQSWVRHQIMTTTDFATDNKLISHLFGGFNHHIVHHLYPNICHIHYPSLTKILKKTCEEFEMPYSCNPKLSDAILSHFKFLKMRSLRKEPVPYLEM